MKFFDVVPLELIDAVLAIKNAPETSRRFSVDLHHGCTIHIETNWGRAPGFATDRGARQGSVGGPSLSKKVQEPRMRFIEEHSDPYMVCGILPVHGSFCVDDGRMYASSTKGLLGDLLERCSASSLLTGIGDAFDKSHICATE